MRFTTKFSRFTTALALSLIVLTARAVRADDAAPAPVQIAALTAKSLDSVAALAKEIGIPLPPFLTAAGLEEQFPFIGKDGLAGDKPIGIVFFGTPNTSPEKLITFVFPIKAGGATLDSLKTLGGKPMPGHDDTVILNGEVGLRRTADFLIFSPSPAAAAAVKPEDFAGNVKDADSLAKLVINVADVRKSIPDMVNGFLENVQKDSKKDDNEAYNAGQKFVFDGVKSAVNTLDRVEIGVDANEKNIRLSAMATPVKIPAVAAVAQPGMPAGVIGRIDVGVSSGAMFPQVRQLLETAVNAGINDDKSKPHTDEEKKQAMDLVKRAINLEADATATSIGVEISEGLPVVYVVQHWSKAMDAPTEIREIVASITALAAKENQLHENSLEVKTYEVDGVSVQHVVAMEKGKAVGSLDVAQRGDEVYYAISAGEAHHIQALLAAPKEAAFKEAASVTIDLGKLADAVLTMPGSDLAKMPPEMQKGLLDLLHGQKAKIALETQGEGAKVELTLDRRILQLIQKVSPK